jgi:PAS domain S-box-containing protein
MPKKPIYAELEKRIAELEQQQLNTQLPMETVDCRQSKEALCGSEELYRAVVENTAAIILRVGPDGIIRFANRRALDFFGYSEEELIGKHAVGTIIPERETSGHDLAAMVEQIAENPDSFHSNANENLRKNGERVWLDWTNSGIYSADGKLKEFLSVGIDSTDRKKNEEALRQSEMRRRMLHETMRDAFVQVNMDGQIIEFNDLYCQMLGYSSDELRALTYQDLTPERWHEFENSIVREQIIARGYSDVYEKEYRRKDGTVFPVELRTILSRDETGQPNSIWGIVRDITARKQAEEGRQTALDRFYTALSSMTFATLLINEDERVEFANQAFCDMFKLNESPADMKMLTSRDVLEKIRSAYPNPEKALTHIMELVERGLHVQDEEVPLRGDRTILRDFIPIWLGDKNYGRLWIHKEITARKQTEEALRESEGRFRALTETSSLAVGVSSSDGKFLYLNKAYEKLFGYTLKDLNRLNASELWQNPEGRRQMIDDVKSKGFLVDYEVALKRKDGTPFWAMLSVNSIDYGGDQAIMASVYDITERKQSEEQLINSQKTFAELVERAPFGIYIVDSQFRIAHMNVASQNDAFRNVRPLIGRAFSEAMHTLWPESVAEEIIGHFRHTLETGEPYYSPRFTNPRHDVEILESYEWELHRMKLPDGQCGVICYYFDSTELRNAELALKKANATLEKKVEERTIELTQRAAQLRALAGELTLAEQRERSRLANILHDHLQQLLVAAKFRLTILSRGGDDIVKQATKEVEELIDESIVSSRSLTAELSPPILYEAGLNEGLQWLARRMAGTQGLFVDLELNDSESLPEDLRILLFQSIRELLFNVVKHAHTRSAVVNMRRVDSSLQVTVSDQGVGFDPTAMPAAGEGGRGFGLFGIRERLELMGGTLEIQSNPGQGSQFVLSVPVARPTKIEPQSRGTLVLPEAPLTSSKCPDLSRKIRVMLVDDHAVVRQGMANLLGDESDIEVVGQAADGQEAVELASKMLPDVILMDMSMPKLNGVEATRIIHNDWPEIRIIGLSMFEEIDRAQAMRDAGAVDYLTKTGQSETMIHAIRSSFRASKKELSFKL